MGRFSNTNTKIFVKNLTPCELRPHNSAMITDRRKSTTNTKITLYEIYSFHFTVIINSKSVPWPAPSVQETSQNFLRRPTRVDNTAYNTGITQSQAAEQPVTIDY